VQGVLPEKITKFSFEMKTAMQAVANKALIDFTPARLLAH
jgi:hypothetical protein